MTSVRAAVLAACLLATTAAVAAQMPDEDGMRWGATRTELESLASRLDSAATAPSGDDAARARARTQLAAIRARLSEGDFHAGDRIALAVRNDPPTTALPGSGRSLEQQLSDTFTVGAGGQLDLPVVGAVALRGVLRSELDGQLTQAVARLLRSPVVHAYPLVRLSVQGGVSRPGYYQVSADAALADVVMKAGGPTAGARLGSMRVERDGRILLKGDELQRAVAEGRTVEQMGLRPGDQFVVPPKRDASERIRDIGVALSVPVTLLTLIALLRRS